jgi:luciferase family oxidoreductase group 1
MSPFPVPLSVLDLASVGRGADSATALQGTTRLAQTADRLGFHRFWVAEHHNMPIVASTSPPVLMAHLAAVTERIRIGSGGVMLPNHPPLVVAEQIALLEALHPGRIDLGIGRAPGTDPRTAAALRRNPDTLDAREFPQELIDLMGLLGDVREGSRLHDRFRATPAPTSHTPVFLLGSSGFSAQLAGILGLPFVQAHHFDMGGTDESLQLYRQRFQPSANWKEPYAIVSAGVVIAETNEEAHRLSLPGRLVRLWLRTGRPVWLPTVEEAETHPDLDAALSMPTETIIGDSERVRAGLDALLERTKANELIITGTSADYEEKVRSLELVAAATGLPQTQSTMSAIESTT